MDNTDIAFVEDAQDAMMTDVTNEVDVSSSHGLLKFLGGIIVGGLLVKAIDLGVAYYQARKLQKELEEFDYDNFVTPAEAKKAEENKDDEVTPEDDNN